VVSRLNSFLTRKVLEVQNNAVEAANKLGDMSLKNQCRVVNRLRKIGQMNKTKLMLGFREEWAGKGSPEVILQPYRDEPEFESVMKNFKITWDELEAIAREVG
jgi:hypothetical protein